MRGSLPVRPGQSHRKAPTCATTLPATNGHASWKRSNALGAARRALRNCSGSRDGHWSVALPRTVCRAREKINPIRRERVPIPAELGCEFGRALPPVPKQARFWGIWSRSR